MGQTRKDATRFYAVRTGTVAFYAVIDGAFRFKAVVMECKTAGISATKRFA